MKTTVEISDALLDRLRAKAARERTSIRSLLDAAIRQFLTADARAREGFKLKDASVNGSGLSPGVTAGDWEVIRERAYEGRGG